MDCNTARLLLEFARPRAGELEATEADVLDNHLTGCPDCATLARGQRQFDHALGKAMRQVEVPNRLGATLHARLETDLAERHRRRMFQAVRGLAVAALVLVALGLGYSWWRTQRLPEVNGEVAWDRHKEAEAHGKLEPDEVEKAFKERGIETVVPRDLKYGHLLFSCMADFQGQQVPCLFFKHAGDGRHAQVLILSDRQFNLKKLKPFQSPPDPAYQKMKIEVIDVPPNRRYAYVILYTGGDLDWLRASQTTL